MLSLKGIYQDGQIQLEQPIISRKPMTVIITFLEDDNVQELQPQADEGTSRFHQSLAQIGFIGCAEGERDLSAHYKDYLSVDIIKKYDNR